MVEGEGDKGARGVEDSVRDVKARHGSRRGGRPAGRSGRELKLERERERGCALAMRSKSIYIGGMHMVSAPCEHVHGHGVFIYITYFSINKSNRPTNFTKEINAPGLPVAPMTYALLPLPCLPRRILLGNVVLLHCLHEGARTQCLEGGSTDMLERERDVVGCKEGESSPF